MHHAGSCSSHRPSPDDPRGVPARARRSLLAAVAALLAAACGTDPVAWVEGERSEPIPPPSAATGTTAPEAVADSLLRDVVHTRLRCEGARQPGDTAAGSCERVAVSSPVVAAAPVAAEAMCPGSLRLAEGRGAIGAVWWSPRPGGGAWLLYGRSTDGGRTWAPPIPVDTLDRATGGCARQAPSIAVDARNGYVHVAYSLVAPEGEGIFYAHQMDPRAAFEPPQVVVYGERPAATSVASDGDLLVVAYEDPNTGGRPFVSLALSRTGGHTFDERFAVTGRTVASVRPQVAVRGGRVAVGWVERPSPASLSALDDPSTAAGAGSGFLVVRVGTIR